MSAPTGTESVLKTRKKGEIDPAALAVASLVAAVSVIVGLGAYTPRCTMIGLTILFVIFGYDFEPHRTWRESLAFSAVCALVSLLALGYPLAWGFAANRTPRLHALLADPEHVLGLWFVLLCVFFAWDLTRCRLKKRPTH